MNELEQELFEKRLISIARQVWIIRARQILLVQS